MEPAVVCRSRHHSNAWGPQFKLLKDVRVTTAER